MARIQYQLDEHVANAVALEVRKQEIDVVTAAEIGLLGRPDIEVLSYARTALRVIVTNDADFLALNALGAPHCGIVFWDQEIRTIGELIATLVLIHAVYSPEDMVGRVEFVFES
jgi:predicted nuclease of predicted toxin-antitoxin system